MIRPESWLLFQLLNANYSCFSSPSLTWDAFESYKTAQDFVCSVKVVNNAAERDVKLHSGYAAVLIDNDKQRESLLQAVEQHQQPSYLPIMPTINRYCDQNNPMIKNFCIAPQNKHLALKKALIFAKIFFRRL